MWRALDSSPLCIQNKPVIPVNTSVYCLLLTNFIFNTQPLPPTQHL
jgi:hypothetical protein